MKKQMKLKRCPFCGSPAELIKEKGDFTVRCTGRGRTECYLETSYIETRMWLTEKFAIESWNRRMTVLPKNVKKLCEEVLELEGAGLLSVETSGIANTARKVLEGLK